MAPCLLKVVGKSGVLYPSIHPLFTTSCPRPKRGPLSGVADFGVMIWVGSHIIRQNSDARQGNTFRAFVCPAYRLPTGSESAPKGLPKGCICAPKARRFFLPNAPKGLPKGCICAPKARPLWRGYSRPRAELRQWLDTSSGLRLSNSLNAHFWRSP